MPVPANIAARIVFATALSSWESQIRGWLDQAWDSFSDSTVRNMLLSLESDNRVLNFNYVLNSTGQSLPGSYSVDINPSAPGFTDPQQKIYLFGSDGKPFEVTPARAVYHEMVHAILGLDDGPTGYPGVPFSPSVLANADVAELRGPTVDKENAIAAGIGDPNIRVSYTGGGTFVELGGRTEVSWSDGELLTTALVDQDTGTTAQTWDLSHLGTSTDLFLAMGGDDTVFGGGGNDYLYGGDGNDQLYGGQGNDVLHGGNIGTTYTSHPLGTPNYSDGFDTANYLYVKNDGILGFFREKSAAPIAITVAPSFGPRPLGATTDIISVDDGTGGTDRLLSIEKIIGTVHNDTVSVTGGAILGGPLTIDLDGGVNSISYNGGTPTTLDGPINYLYRTTLEDGTPTGRDGPQTVTIAAGVDKVLLQNSLLYVDGQQLVGGSSFKINRQDYTTTEQANNIFDVPDVVNYAEALAYKAQAVVQNPTAGGSIWDTVLYSDQETRRTVGVWGERYEFAGTNFDVPGTLTITIRDAADYQIQLSGWKNGDFGIFLIDGGLASALDNNGRLDDWGDLYLPDVVAQLGSVGFSQHIYTDPESETLEGAQRNGTTGHDVILGSAQADSFRGTLGNDTLSGGEGNDTYYFGLGHGNDVIIETTTGQNTIELASSVSVGTIQQSVDGNDLVLSFGSTQGGSIRILDTTDWSRWTILNLTDPSPTLDGLGSSDKVIINGTAASETLSSPDTLSMIQERLFGFDGNDLLKGERGEDDLIGGAGSDTLVGGSGNDRLEGGVGDDLMIGGVNYDTYIYSEGDGNDTILDEGQTKTLESDTLRLVGLPLTSTNAIVLKTANGQGAILSFAGVSGSITITNQFLGAGQHGIRPLACLPAR